MTAESADIALPAQALTLTLLEQVQEGCVTFDSHWRFTYVNAEAEALLQRSRAQLLRRPLAEVFPEITAVPFYQQFRNAIEREAPIAFTAFHPPLGKWFELRAHPYGTGLAVSFRDITQVRAAETALRQSERRFRVLMEQAGDAFFLHTGEGRIVDVNRQACLSLGASRETLLGMTVDQIEQNFDRETISQLMASLDPGRVLTLQGCHRRLDGSTFPVELRLSRLDLEGSPMFFALVRDDTERRHREAQLQQALREAEAGRDRITAILQSVADALIVTDHQGCVLLMNCSAELLTGAACEVAAGRPLHTILRQEPLGRELNHACRTRGDSAFEVELSDPAAEGRKLVLQGRVAPIRDARGQFLGHISLLRDVTRERQIDRLKSEFVSTAAHELRTPLTSILGFTEILLDHAANDRFDAEQRREFLDIIYEKAEALTRLVDELLDLGRIEAGHPIRLDLQECDLGELLTRTIRRHADMDRDHAYVLELPEQPLQLQADPRKLTQVLDNLLDNAAKYSPAASTIRINARRTQDCSTIEIADAGIGMTPQQLDHAFDKFYRADTSNTAREGLGIGLTICRNIVQLHGGHIRLESSPGRGTTARLQFPCRATAATALPAT